MNKNIVCIGLMSGTSGDGMDASIAVSDGENNFKVLLNEYSLYPKEIYHEYHKLKENVLNFEDINKNSKKLRGLERKITIFTSSFVEKIKKKLSMQKKNIKIDLIGFHGQTILHSPEKQFSLQLGDGQLLSQLTKTKVIYKFRENDLKNGGQGAPLAPIFHKFLINKKKIKPPITILNLGGIANITTINHYEVISSSDIGPGNCLIDSWVRLNSKLKFDKGGNIARSGKINKIILDQSLENFYENKISEKKSFDINDFHFSFARGLSLEDGAATLTEFTAEICSKKITTNKVYVCGGGRNNLYLLEKIQNKTGCKIEPIDKLNIEGDFVESQAFAYLAVRSFLKKPITFPETTGCSKPLTGGILINNN